MDKETLDELRELGLDGPAEGMYTDAYESEMVFTDGEDGQGVVEARVAQLGVKNANGRTIMPGSLPRGVAQIQVSEWNHSSFPMFGSPGQPSVGYGEVREDEDGKFYVATMRFYREERGERVYNRLRDSKSIQWSIGYIPAKFDTEGRIVTNRVFEASPVILGASPGTRTTRVDLEGKETEDVVRPKSAVDYILDRYRK